MIPLIEFLKEHDWDTVACCCGHAKYPITVIVKYRINGKPIFCELFTNIRIDRTKRFYIRDKQGYYYIPEVNKKHG